jgi:hypothetical protein
MQVLLIILGSVIVCVLAATIYFIFITKSKSPAATETLDAAEDHQRIDTKDPFAPRFSDKIIIHSSIP